MAISIIILSTEMRPVPKCSLTCSKTGINRSLVQANFVDAFPFQTGLWARPWLNAN